MFFHCHLLPQHNLAGFQCQSLSPPPNQMYDFHFATIQQQTFRQFSKNRPLGTQDNITKIQNQYPEMK